METNSSRLAKNTLLLYFRQILIMAVSLYTVRVVLNTLGAEDYGIYNVVAGVVTMFGFLSGAMASSSQRYFSYDLGKNDAEHLKTTFSVTFQIYVLIALVIVALAETLGLWFVNTKLVIADGRMTAANWIFQAAIVSFLLSLITTPYMASIIAHENMSVYAYVSIVEASMKLGIVFLLKILPYDKLILYSLLMMSVALVNTSIYRIYCHKKYEECRVRFIKDGALLKEIISYSGWNLFGNIAGMIKNQGISILLNLHFGAIVNAARGIASQVNSAVSSFAQNFSTALRPQIIKSYAANQKDETMRLVYRGCKFTFFLMYIFTLPLCLEMKGVLGLWLKNVPDYSVIFTQLTLIEVLVDSISFPIMALAQATGKIRLYQGVVGGILLLNLPLSYVALMQGFPPYSVMLVMIALSITAFIVRLFIVAKLSGLSVKQFIVKTIIPCFVVSSCSVIVPIFFVNKIEESILRIFATVFISVVCTALCILFLGMTKNERNVVLKKITLFFHGKKNRSVITCKIERLHVEKVENCTGCHACFSCCTKKAVSMQPNIEGFLYPVIDKPKCVNCGLCEKVCPAINPINTAVSAGSSASKPVAYAAFNNDEEVRLNSSSGGIFTAIAQKIIEQDGVVFGAKFTDDFSVAHGWTDSVEGLKDFQGSKYVQSVIGSSYKDCKIFLEQGRKVLFSGTPCQIQGLKKYLKKEYENLFTVDFICHGVPSNKLWQKYKIFREKKSASQTVKTAFRRKNDGWKQFSLSFTYANDSEYCASHRKDLYMKIFLTDIALRSSCYKCPVRFLNRPSDITLADFWGIQNVLPQFDDDKGTSLVMLHSSQAAEFWSILKDSCTMEQIILEQGIKYNPSMVRSPKMPKARKKFYFDLETKPFEKVLKKYTTVSLWHKLCRLPYRVAKKIFVTIHKWGGVAQYSRFVWATPAYRSYSSIFVNRKIKKVSCVKYANTQGGFAYAA